MYVCGMDCGRVCDCLKQVRWDMEEKKVCLQDGNTNIYLLTPHLKLKLVSLFLLRDAGYRVAQVRRHSDHPPRHAASVSFYTHEGSEPCAFKGGQTGKESPCWTDAGEGGRGGSCNFCSPATQPRCLAVRCHHKLNFLNIKMQGSHNIAIFKSLLFIPRGPFSNDISAS